MKPYACRPAVRTGYRPYVAPTFVSPYFRTEVKSNDLKTTRPGTNILRTENAYQIELAVPGVPKDQIQIQVIEDQLAISATNPNQGTEQKFVRQEFDFTNFRRVFNLHKNADASNLKASFANGILTIVVPDKEPETWKIEIQ